jgi:hypothetical protein
LEIWEKLLEKAIHYIQHSSLPPNTDRRIHWSLGGGTVLMMKYRHRMSKDIDVFLANPQFLGYFSPRLNDVVEADIEYYDEQTEYIKLFYGEGEIDFIVADRLLEEPYDMFSKFGMEIPRENPVEIIAKKVFYRYRNFARRDFFDLATVLHHATDLETLEIRNFISPFTEDLHAQLAKALSFKDINILPEGEIIQNEGYAILSSFLNSIYD